MTAEDKYIEYIEQVGDFYMQDPAEQEAARQVYLEALEEENKLLSLIEETEDIDDTLYYQRKLMNHYLKTNQLDKRHAAYAEYADLVKSIEELDTLDI